MITYHSCSTVDELLQILNLQQENLPTSVSENERKTDGFVTVHHQFDILKRMNDVRPHIIAKLGNKVVGYALCMHPKFGNEIEVLKPMFTEISRLIHLDSSTAPAHELSMLRVTVHDFIVMGQVCIDKEHRKQGIFRKLYEFMLMSIKPEFLTIITEVDSSNTRSLDAHYGIGFNTLSKYKADGRDWELIYLK